MVKHLRPQLGEPQAAGRPFKQANPEMILELGYPTANRRYRYLEAACRFREAVSFDHLGEHHQRIEICHRLAKNGKFIFRHCCLLGKGCSHSLAAVNSTQTALS